MRIIDVITHPDQQASMTVRLAYDGSGFIYIYENMPMFTEKWAKVLFLYPDDARAVGEALIKMANKEAPHAS